MAKHADMLDESMVRIRYLHTSICREIERDSSPEAANKRARLEGVWQNYSCQILASLSANKPEREIRQMVDHMEGAFARVLKEHSITAP